MSLPATLPCPALPHSLPADAVAAASSVPTGQAWRNLLTQRRFLPQLVLSALIPTFQQWTGG